MADLQKKIELYFKLREHLIQQGGEPALDVTAQVYHIKSVAPAQFRQSQQFFL